MLGNDGNDVFLLAGSSGGNDVAVGGAGFNQIQVIGTNAADTLLVGQINGTLMLSRGTATITAESQIDNALVNGLTGNAQITVSDLVAVQVAIQVVINGGAGNDILNASNVNLGRIRLAMNGDDGTDTITGSLGNDTITGGDDADAINGSTGNDSISGQDGDDVLAGELGNDTLDGGNGADFFTGQEGNDSLVGGDSANTLKGFEGDDTLSGDAGDDLLDGMDGNNAIFSGLGWDVLIGGNGKDIIIGDDGNDRINGRDTVAGNQGNDVITDPPAEIHEDFVLSLALRTLLESVSCGRGSWKK